MTTTIAITGVQGAGKTTLTNQLHDICRHRGLKTVVVSEVADRCPHPLNTDAGVDGQRWIWQHQMLAELEARNAHPTIIICDRSLMDNLCYLALIPGADSKTEFSQLYGITHQWMLGSYDYVVRLPLNEEWLMSANNPNRSPDLDYARRVDRVMDNLVQRYVNIERDELVKLLEGMRKS